MVVCHFTENKPGASSNLGQPYSKNNFRSFGISNKNINADDSDGDKDDYNTQLAIPKSFVPFSGASKSLKDNNEDGSFDPIYDLLKYVLENPNLENKNTKKKLKTFINFEEVLK